MKPDPRAAVLAILTEHAERGYVCPHLNSLAKDAGCSAATVSAALDDLRRAKVISYRLVKLPVNKLVRVVTITATGKSTREPGPTTRYVPDREAYNPTATALTSPGRVLQGKERAHWKAFYEAREAELRRRKEMTHA
jgi:DNA-binding transcriptional MocR family regulator